MREISTKKCSKIFSAPPLCDSRGVQLIIEFGILIFVKPALISVILTQVQENKSLVQLTYSVPSDLNGLEIMGVDAGLSWLKGESITANKAAEKEEYQEYQVILELEDTCEFRGRGFDADQDFWEDTESNHKLFRNENGTIRFESELEPFLYTFKGYLPTDYEPSFEDVENRITNIETIEPSIFQVLIDVSYWIPPIFEKELEESSIYPISAIIRVIKEKSRDYQSMLVDNVTQPIINSLFDMYLSSMENTGEDLRKLSSVWSEKGYKQIFVDLPEKVKELEQQRLGIGEDGLEKFKELLKYVS